MSRIRIVNCGYMFSYRTTFLVSMALGILVVLIVPATQSAKTIVHIPFHIAVGVPAAMTLLIGYRLQKSANVLVLIVVFFCVVPLSTYIRYGVWPRVNVNNAYNGIDPIFFLASLLSLTLSLGIWVILNMVIGKAILNTSIVCHDCGYMLKGLSKNRCPECGTEFDPELLKKLQTAEPAPGETE